MSVTFCIAVVLVGIANFVGDPQCLPIGIVIEIYGDGVAEAVVLLFMLSHFGEQAFKF